MRKGKRPNGGMVLEPYEVVEKVDAAFGGEVVSHADFPAWVHFGVRRIRLPAEWDGHTYHVDVVDLDDWIAEIKRLFVDSRKEIRHFRDQRHDDLLVLWGPSTRGPGK